MKRWLPFFPLFFLFIFNSCTGAAPGISSEVGTAVANTQTAAMWTAIPTFTPNPNIPNIVTWLNNDLSTINPLESTLDAEYHVIDISFSRRPDRSGLLFRVDVDCRCMNGAECCIPERTFVVIIEAMKRNATTILTHVPGDVSEILVVCTEHRAGVGAMTAAWQDVRGYLQYQISGYQLGMRVSRTDVP